MRLAAIVLVAFALWGCGGGTLSASDLRTRASSICLAASARTRSIVTPASPAGAKPFLQRGLAVLTPELEKLMRLKAPKDLAPLYARALGSLRQELAVVRGTVAELGRDPDLVAVVGSLERRLAPLRASADHAWTALGIRACTSI